MTAVPLLDAVSDIETKARRSLGSGTPTRPVPLSIGVEADSIRNQEAMP
jgi:hypothetical protein